MDANENVVTIPFASVVEPDQNTFKVEIPPSFRTGKKERQFSLDFATLVPEYYSMKAAELQMDPDDVMDVQHQIQLMYKWNQEYIDKKVGEPWQFSAKAPKMSQVLKSLNAHLEANKPKGCRYPIAFFDWIYTDYMGSDMDIKTYHELTAEYYYDEDYDEERHGNALPLSLKDYPGPINHMMYPTVTSKTFVENVRIRMHIMPNGALAFSNDNLLTAMGFSMSEQVSPGKVSNQFRVYGYSDVGVYRVVEAKNEGKLTVTENTAIKVYQHIEKSIGLSSVRAIVTNRMREADPVKLVEDINQGLEAIGQKMNYDVKLEFVPDRRYCKLRVSEAGTGTTLNVQLTLFAQEKLASLLGFKNKKSLSSDDHGDVLAAATTTITEMEVKARTLAYDTGMVIAKVENNPNYTTSGFNEVVLGALMPKYDGTLATMSVPQMRPKIAVSKFDKDLEIGLYRYNEMGQVMPLKWKVRAYMLGQLVGL